MLAAEKEAEEAVAEKGGAGGRSDSFFVSGFPRFLPRRSGKGARSAPAQRRGAGATPGGTAPLPGTVPGGSHAGPGKGAEAGAAPVRAAEIAVRLGMLEQVLDPLETLRYPTG